MTSPTYAFSGMSNDESTTVHKALDALTWEADVKVVRVYFDGTIYLWGVVATWDDFHGATLHLEGQSDTIEEAASQIQKLKDLADSEWKE